MTARSAVASPVPADYTPKHGQDQSHDANFALMELEKGLRSGKTGEQCEAIVHVPALLEKYPFPILVNSAFLKLADVFRAGSNFMKLCVLKAIQSSKKHLDKIFNVDEFCRKFFAVIHSNDPIARAVTLRVFGNISPIIAERKNIHHCIRNSLDSHDAAEVEAAIYATKCFAEQSSTFASSIWQKIADMIEGLTTPIEMKLKLLPVFKFMYHDISIANKIMALCENLLLSYPAHMFVVTILNTTTQLALSTLINIPQQVNLLLRYVKDDPRKSINLIGIKNLHMLAKKVLHLWESKHVDELVSTAVNCLHENIKLKILQVVSLLSSSVNGANIFSDQVLEKLEDLSSDFSTDISTLAFEIRVHVTCAQKASLDADVITALESDVQMMFALSLSDNSLMSLKRCLSATELLIAKSTDVSCLMSFLVECLTSLNGDFLLEVCHTLVSMSTYRSGLTSNYTMPLLNLFENRLQITESKEDKDVLVALLILILQSSQDKNITKKVEIQEKLFTHVISLANSYWMLYRMARQASRMVYPILASKLFHLLTTEVSSENLYFWLKALGNFQDGEAVLMYEVQSVAKLQELLMSAHNHYQEGLTTLKAAVTTDHPLYFQFKFARLRSDMLRAYSQLLTCCSSLKLNPPPAYAILRQEIHQSTRLSIQFQNCGVMFSNVAMGYQNLFKTSFNSDKTSLHIIQLLQESCQLMAYAVETLASQRTGERLCPEFHDSLCTKTMNQYLQTLTAVNLSMLQDVQDTDLKTKEAPLCHLQVNCLTSTCLSQLKVGISYPLHFFKSLQNTKVQLSVSPGNSIPEDPYLVNVLHEMALKIEGVILERSHAANFRHATKVNLTVKIKPSETVRNITHDVKPIQATEIILRESTEPHNDYFNAQFLLSFKYLGHHMIKITTGITDELGIDWETGPNCVIHVDVYEHGHYKRK